jgi:hypothetical protein
MGESPYSVVVACHNRAHIPPKEKFSANEEAVNDCERARRPDYYETDVVPRRVSLYRCGPHLESNVRKM